MSHEGAEPIRLDRFVSQGRAGSVGLELDFEQRQKSRLRTRLTDGREVAIKLPRGRCLRTGDLLSSACGIVVVVVSAPESLTEASAHDPLGFARACYHMGNRHVPLQIAGGRMRFQPDHVLEAMLASLGLDLRTVVLPFEPEAGAYSGPGSAAAHGHTHGHDHAHGDGSRHTHSHGHPHTGGHARAQDRAGLHVGADGEIEHDGRARIHVMDAARSEDGGGLR